MLLILNDIGGFEILLILVIILVFFGSKSIPSLARTFGRTIRQIKDASEDIKKEIKKSTNEMKGDLDLKGLIRETSEDIRRPLDQYAQDIDNAVKYTPTKKRVEIEPKQDDSVGIGTAEVVETSNDAKETLSDQTIEPIFEKSKNESGNFPTEGVK